MSMFTEWLLLYCIKMMIHLHGEIYQKTKLENYKITKYLVKQTVLVSFIGKESTFYEFLPLNFQKKKQTAYDSNLHLIIYVLV